MIIDLLTIRGTIIEYKLDLYVIFTEYVIIIIKEEIKY